MPAIPSGNVIMPLVYINHNGITFLGIFLELLFAIQHEFALEMSYFGPLLKVELQVVGRLKVVGGRLDKIY